MAGHRGEHTEVAGVVVSRIRDRPGVPAVPRATGGGRDDHPPDRAAGGRAGERAGPEELADERRDLLAGHPAGRYPDGHRDGQDHRHGDADRVVRGEPAHTTQRKRPWSGTPGRPDHRNLPGHDDPGPARGAEPASESEHLRREASGPTRAAETPVVAASQRLQRGEAAAEKRHGDSIDEAEPGEPRPDGVRTGGRKPRKHVDAAAARKPRKGDQSGNGRGAERRRAPLLGAEGPRGGGPRRDGARSRNMDISPAWAGGAPEVQPAERDRPVGNAVLHQREAGTGGAGEPQRTKRSVPVPVDRVGIPDDRSAGKRAGEDSPPAEPKRGRVVAGAAQPVREGEGEGAAEPPRTRWEAELQALPVHTGRPRRISRLRGDARALAEGERRARRKGGRASIHHRGGHEEGGRGRAGMDRRCAARTGAGRLRSARRLRPVLERAERGSHGRAMPDRRSALDHGVLQGKRSASRG